MATAATKLTADDVDDLIYACRTNSLDWLREMLTTWSTQMNIPEGDIIRNAIDVDEEGMGSRACLLHYPAANGNLELVQFLLEKLAPTTTSSQVDGGGGGGESQSQITQLVNHQNVNGNTPLHWAALNGHLDIVQTLVKAGADPTIVNEAGKDAVVEAEYSAKEKAAECAAWLLKECEALEQSAGRFSTREESVDQDGQNGTLANGDH